MAAGCSWPQIAAHVQVARAGSAAQPLHRAAGGEIQIQLADIHGHRAGRLVQVGDHHGADRVRALDDRRQVLQVGAAKRHVRDRDQLRLFVDGVQQQFHRQRESVGRGHRHDARADARQPVIDVIVGRKVEPVGDQLVAAARPIEARRHHRLADGDVLLHHHLAFARADDAPDQVAHRDRHLPPALFPRADAAGGPRVGELAHAPAARRGMAPSEWLIM